MMTPLHDFMRGVSYQCRSEPDGSSFLPSDEIKRPQIKTYLADQRRDGANFMGLQQALASKTRRFFRQLMTSHYKFGLQKQSLNPVK
jgi:hypothetical protein